MNVRRTERWRVQLHWRRIELLTGVHGKIMADIDLTIVIEMDTKEITGGIYDYYASLHEWLKQADALYPRRCELLVSSSYDHLTVEQLSTERTPIKNIYTPGANYYGLKNAGANAALGRIVFFSDSDCRPHEGFLVEVLTAFEDPAVQCAAGRSVYDGVGLLTRINSTTSFGYLHQGDSTLESSCVLSHNVAVRRDSYQRDVFGPFNGRMTGDMYLTNCYRQHSGVRIVPGMLIYHEDYTFNLRGLLDRHLRDIFYSLNRLVQNDEPPRFRKIFRKVMRKALKRPIRQLQLLGSWGHALGVYPRHYPIAVLMFSVHAVLNISASLVILLVPSLTRRWLNYEFGAVNGVSD